jgi:hypothetical protein
LYKVFFSTYIHSTAPFCGIDPAPLRRVDSEDQVVSRFCPRDFYQPTRFHAIRVRAGGSALLVDKNLGCTKGRNHPNIGQFPVKDRKQATWALWQRLGD